MILDKRSWQLPERLATPEEAVLNRRQVLRKLGLGSMAMALSAGAGAASLLGCGPLDPLAPPRGLLNPAVGRRFSGLFPAWQNPAFDLENRTLTPEDAAASTNNFYEFSHHKGEVWELARGFPVDPWTVEVAGLVARPRKLGLEEIFRLAPLEERLYRFRCVERWAMQVPWTGYPLRRLVEALEPLSTARYIRFVSVADETRMLGLKIPFYPWPYHEALRLDEAMNDLAFVALGIYGHALPMQHGAPWRIVCPWKYGYKSPKSIVRIELTDTPPPTFWSSLYPEEYGFFSNVDPGKPHPRWSQATEEDIGSLEKRPTLLYNGYQAQVAALYDGSEH